MRRPLCAKTAAREWESAGSPRCRARRAATRRRLQQRFPRISAFVVIDRAGAVLVEALQRFLAVSRFGADIVAAGGAFFGGSDFVSCARSEAGAADPMNSVAERSSGVRPVRSMEDAFAKFLRWPMADMTCPAPFIHVGN
jgi:hypothetical protein